MSRTARLVALVAALTLLPASAALAHPSLNPNAVPVGEPVDTTLVVPHGCSSGDQVMPDEDSAVATTRFDLQLIDGVEVEPRDVDGWDVAVDDEAVSWTDAGGATTDPIELPITLTVHDGEPGDELNLNAYQECEDGQSYRWTEGSEDTPPVRLELTAGGTGSADQEHTDSHTDDETASEGPTATGTEEEPTEATAEPTATEDTPQAVPLPDSARASSFSPVPWLVVAVLAAAIAAGIVWARRKGAA